jgi:hypothetical protein
MTSAKQWVEDQIGRIVVARRRKSHIDAHCAIFSYNRNAHMMSLIRLHKSYNNITQHHQMI